MVKKNYNNLTNNNDRIYIPPNLRYKKLDWYQLEHDAVTRAASLYPDKHSEWTWHIAFKINNARRDWETAKRKYYTDPDTKDQKIAWYKYVFEQEKNDAKREGGDEYLETCLKLSWFIVEQRKYLIDEYFAKKHWCDRQQILWIARIKRLKQLYAQEKAEQEARQKQLEKEQRQEESRREWERLQLLQERQPPFKYLKNFRYKRIKDHLIRLYFLFQDDKKFLRKLRNNYLRKYSNLGLQYNVKKLLKDTKTFPVQTLKLDRTLDIETNNPMFSIPEWKKNKFKFKSKYWRFIPWWWDWLQITEVDLLFHYWGTLSLHRKRFKSAIFKHNKKWLRERMFTIYTGFVGHLNQNSKMVWKQHYKSQKHTRLINFRTRFLYSLNYFFQRIKIKNIKNFIERQYNTHFVDMVTANFEITTLISAWRNQFSTRVSQCVHLIRFGYISINNKITKNIYKKINLEDTISIWGNIFMDLAMYSYIVVGTTYYSKIYSVRPYWIEDSKFIPYSILVKNPNISDVKLYQEALSQPEDMTGLKLMQTSKNTPLYTPYSVFVNTTDTYDIIVNQDDYTEWTSMTSFDYSDPEDILIDEDDLSDDSDEDDAIADLELENVE